MKNFRKLRHAAALRVPLFAWILFALAPVAVFLHIAAFSSPAFADFFGGTVGLAVRFVLAKLTSWLPFSLCEAALIGLPILFAAVLTGAMRKMKRGKLVLTRYYAGMLAVLVSVYTVFVFTLGTGYAATPLAEKLGLEEAPVTAEELHETALWLTDLTNAAADDVSFRFGGFSEMPYDYGEMNEVLMAAYEKAAEKYGFISHFRSRVKPVILSEPWTYTHIAGVYTFFTGESNLNINYPDYSLPYTAAHELSHQRGIARENEANFMAFLVSLESDDPYLRYSGALSVLEYYLSALHTADKDAYTDVLARLDTRVIGELNAFSVFFEKYRDNTVADISGAVNDTFLQIQGQTAGSRSYGLVVDLGVAYYQAMVKNPD